MQKQEFEERIERTVTDEQYKVIEEVYMWHPSIRNTSGKDEVAELYKSFGMTIFHDMLPRAKKAHELDELLRNAQREVQRIQEEIEELSCPTLRVDYLEGYEVDEAAMGEMISRATNTQSGCFRLLDRTLNNVLRILKQKGETRITMKIVSEASNMMML